MIRPHRIGILVGGGPAPGINCAISSATIEARNNGVEVVGILDGFEHLLSSPSGQVVELDIADVSRIHNQGGSILRTSRANPTSDPRLVENVVAALHNLGISALITIGGEDTATSAAAVSEAAKGGIRVAHIPKTIDNDLPLPSGMPTFGYETARQVGTEQVLNLMEEARTGNRWILVVVMGRSAGHLALGIGKAAGATLTIIPEEFCCRTVTFDALAGIIETSMMKRRAAGHDYGVAILAEGLAAQLDTAEMQAHFGDSIRYDPHGHVRLDEIPLGSALRRHIESRMGAKGHAVKLNDVMLGYTLRCAPPVPFDIDYTRTLGYGAVRALLTDGGHDGLIALVDGRIEVIPFATLVDPRTGRIPPRRVDIESEHYRVARHYMIR